MSRVCDDCGMTVLEALENDAELFKDSANDILLFIEAISSDDIDGLLSAKQKYRDRLKNFTSKEQEKRLDKMTCPKDEQIQRHDYFEILKIMILMIIKMNEEFCLKDYSVVKSSSENKLGSPR